MTDRFDHHRDCLQRLDRMHRFATERLGLGHNHPLLRDIDRLALVWNEREYRRVSRALKLHRAEKNGAVNIGDRVPPSGTLKGDLRLGTAVNTAGTPADVCIPPWQLILNTLVVGVIGTGKSYLVALILLLLTSVAPEVRMRILDPNRTYERVCRDSSLWLNICWEDLRVNALRAPLGYPYSKYIPEVFDILARGELLHSRYLLVERTMQLFEAAGVPARDDGRTPVPSLFDLLKDLETRKCRPGSKEENYRQTALHVLKGRLETTGSVYDCNRGVEGTVSDTRVRIATDGLFPLESYRFFINSGVQFSYRQCSIAPLLPYPTLRSLTVLEEAQALLDSRDVSLDYYEEILLRSRTLGSAYILIAQDISRIDPVIFSGVSNYFVFAQSSADDKRIVQKVLDLSSRETALLGTLRQGQCFAKFVNHPKWPHAFLMEVAPHD